jgi:deoxyuridine 5'-triphosphate nucleotidohydrolase
MYSEEIKYTNEFAYILGILTRAEYIGPNTVRVSSYNQHVFTLEALFKTLGARVEINPYMNTVTAEFEKPMYDAIARAMNSIPEPPFFQFWLRGLYESTRTVNTASATVVLCNLPMAMADIIIATTNVECVKLNVASGMVDLIYKHSNALDLLAIMYDDISDIRLYSVEHLDVFYKLCGGNESFTYHLTHPLAVPPKKTRASDSGYDMTLVERIKTHGQVEFYDTGVSIQPPYGYYFDLVGRSSISKSGYMIANNIGVIDQSYTGNVIVALVKIDQNAPNLTLPNRLVQIIPRKIVHFIPVQGDIHVTNRNVGGFGSTR